MTIANGESGRPAWYDTAIAVEPRLGEVVVSGTPIRYRVWGSPDRPGVILIHGSAAHSGWWDHVGPSLSAEHCVAAIDLSGHGDSGHRAEYTYQLWASEVMTVAGELWGTTPPLLVGHSMGGLVAVATGAAYRVRGLVLVDTPFRVLDEDERRRREKRSKTKLPRYASRSEAVSRFRAHPEPGRPVLPFVAQRVAENSVAEADGGWTWKFDPAIFRRADLDLRTLARICAPITLLRAEFGRLTAARAAEICDLAAAPVAVVELPETSHHAMLDRPLVLIAALRAALGRWDNDGLDSAS